MQTFTIGRDGSNNIVLDDTFVSRQHAHLIIMDNGEVLLRDLNSSNGSFVNGNKITEAYLRAGDIVKCGHAFLKWSDYLSNTSKTELTVTTYLQHETPGSYSSETESPTQSENSLGTVIKYIFTRVFQSDELFKNNWNRTPSALFFFLVPLGISILSLLYFYSKSEYDFIYQVLLPFTAIILIFGVSQFFTISLLSIKKESNLSKTILASSIFSFLQFFIILLFFTATPYNFGFGRFFFSQSVAEDYFIYLTGATLFVILSITLVVFLYKYYRGIGASRSVSVHFTVFTFSINFLIQTVLVYLLTEITEINLFNF